MNITAITPADLFPSFLSSTVDVLAILTREARKKVRPCRREKIKIKYSFPLYYFPFSDFLIFHNSNVTKNVKSTV